MSAEYAFDTAVMLMRAGRREEAAKLAWDILRVNPKHADAWALRAHVEAHEGRYENAMMHHGFAVGAAPTRYDMWINRGIDAMNAKMHKEAEESFLKSLELQKTFEGHFNYGNLLASRLEIEGAEDHYRAALELRPDHAQANTNLGSLLIGRGQWREGFGYYRSRFSCTNFPPPTRLPYPRWEGEPLAGKTVMLYVEQGFGDEILSYRFVDPIKAMGARVILAVRPPLYRIARTIHGPDAVMLMYDPPPWEPDYLCALLNVPAYVDLSPETVPWPEGYLHAEDRGYRLKFPPGLNVGVCWASGKREIQPAVSEIARQKSLTFEQLVIPLKQPGVNLICLQQHHEDGSKLHELGVHDPMLGVTDFADTAWIIDNLDLVITVDTSVAHLAGALGKSVWNLTRFDALWPWMRATNDTCWYHSMKMYRQVRPFDWSEPIKRVQNDLAAKVACAAAA